jgi:hypothetical protein
LEKKFLNSTTETQITSRNETMFDPVQEKRNQKYTREELNSVFKNGAVAMRLMTENPALYGTMRREAEALGILGPKAIGDPAPYTTRKPQKSYTDRELFLRAKFTAQECREFFNAPAGSKTNPSTLFQTNREAYEEIREASVAHGVLPATPSTPHRTPQARPTEPQPGSGETFELDARICQELSLPAGFRVNQEGFLRAMQAIRNANASKAVAAQKAEQARQDQEAAANKQDNEGR